MILTCSQYSIHPIILKNDKTYFSGKSRNQKEMPSSSHKKKFSCPGLIYIPPNFLLSHRRNCSSSVESQHLHLCLQSSLLSPLLEYCSLLEFLFLWDLQLIPSCHFFPEALESSQHTHFLTSPLTTYLIYCPNSSPPSSQSHLYACCKTLAPQLSFIRIPSTSKSAR